MTHTIETKKRAEYNQRHLGELDLRKEVTSFFDGTDFGNEKFNVFLQRKIRVDSDKYPYTNKVKCPTCNHDYNNEGKLGCPSCDGVGYLWDEKLIIGKVYRPQHIRLADQLSKFTNLGRVDHPAFILLSPYQYKISGGDIIYAIQTTENGGIEIPIIKTHKYMCVSSIPMKLDFNKTEFNSVVISEIT